MIKIRSVYEPPRENDGKRILVDRIWPKRITREKGKIDIWLKEISPSPSLTKWLSSNLKKFSEFAGKYKKELAGPSGQKLLKLIVSLSKREPVTLLSGTKDRERNQAVVLKEIAEKEINLQKPQGKNPQASA